MTPERAHDPAAPAVESFAAGDVAAICRERLWLPGGENDAAVAWCTEAAALLGPHAADRDALAELLSLIFEYDARAVLSRPEHHAVLAREGARDVLRALAIEILRGGEVDSDRLKKIVAGLKEKLPYHNREIFLPLRMALAGRAGEGKMDRVILLLDRAAATEGLAPVKTVRERILEFCAALD
jgi:Anticodon binding domain